MAEDHPRFEGVPSEVRWRSFLSQLALRWYYVRRRALAQSLGVMMLVYGLLVLTAICFRTAFVTFSAYYEGVNRQIRSSSAQGEPRSDLEYPAVIAAVLAPLNDDRERWTLDQRAPSELAAARALMKTFDSLAEFTLAARREEIEVKGSVSVRDFQSELPNLVAPGIRLPASQAWHERIERHFLDFVQGEKTPIRAATEDEMKALVPRVRLQGRVGLQGGPGHRVLSMRTKLLVPSTFDGVVRTRGKGGATPLEYADEGVARAATLSLLLEDVLALGDSMPRCADSTGTRPEMVQAYFISDRSVLRIWPLDYPMNLPVNRYWAGAHYFARFYERSHALEDTFETRPYLDVGGHGLVTTLVRVVEDRSSVDEAKVFGIIAMDFLLPIDEYLDALAEQNMFLEIHQLRVAHGSSLVGPGGASPGELLKARHTFGRTIAVNTLWRSVEDLPLRRRISNHAAAAGPSESITKLAIIGKGREPEFLLPVASNYRGRDIYLIVQPRAPRLPADVYSVAGLGVACLLTALGLLLYWNHQAGREYDELCRATAIRNLDTALIEVDEDDGICAGNLVAEWLLDTTLPQWGERRDAQGIVRRFCDLIAPWIVSLPVGQHAEEGMELPAPVRYRDRIPAERRLGRPSTYLAIVAETGRVIQVTGAPVLVGARIGRPEIPRTTGSLTPVSDALAARVRATVTRAIETHWDDPRA